MAHFPPSWEGVEMRNAILVSQGSSVTPEDGHPHPACDQEDLPKLHLWLSPSASPSWTPFSFRLQQFAELLLPSFGPPVPAPQEGVRQGCACGGLSGI